VRERAHGQLRRVGLADRHASHVTSRTHATLATVPHEGQRFRAEDVEGEWSLTGELPTTIPAVAADGSPTAVSSGH
jgi:hypothetical protein